MAKKIYEETDIQAIANAIRSKNYLTTLYKVSEMAGAINNIETAIEVLPQDTASGAVANFPDGSDNYPIVELIADIAAVQSGSGDPAPDNVRSISGFSSMTIKDKDGENVEQWSETINLDQNVYGGSLNVTTGVLTITHVYKLIKNILWGMQSNNVIRSATEFTNGREGAMCECYPSTTNSPATTTVDKFINFASQYWDNNKRIFIRDTSFSTLNDFLETMGDYALVFPVLEPQTIQLSPTQVNTILGQNNISADTGDVEVTYRADVDLYIQKKLNEAT